MASKRAHHASHDAKSRHKEHLSPGLPPITVLSVERLDEDGELWAVALARTPSKAPPKPAARSSRQSSAPSAVRRRTHDEAPRIRLASSKGAAPQVGDRVLAKLTRQGDALYSAQTLKILPRNNPEAQLGCIDKGAVLSLGKGESRRYKISASPEGWTLRDGDLVRYRLSATSGFQQSAVLLSQEGRYDGLESVGALCLAEAGVPQDFSEQALAEAAAAGPVALGKRQDLRHLPFVTIDGEDARDFDDAVYAEPLAAGGYRLWVAIADVAHYVHPGSALDEAAARRGNSVYLPSQVVPMLPEALSNGWCSLLPGQDRAALVAEMEIDKEGELQSARFTGALIRSAARLTYSAVEAWIDQAPGQALPHPSLVDLYGAHQALQVARVQRGTLALAIPEYRARLSPDQRQVVAIEQRSPTQATQLIENLMVAANVAAAQALAQAARACIYRVHDRPDPAKIETLRRLSSGNPNALKRGTAVTVQRLNALLSAVEPEAGLQALLSEAILRAQSQAVYSPDNGGHFGLGLLAYAHFTSPIRRYADLCVHRALIAAFGLGEGGQQLVPGEALAALCRQLVACERRALAVERRAQERYSAAFLANRIGETFEGRVNGVSRAGLFVQLAQSGATLFVPLRSLSTAYLRYDPKQQRLFNPKGSGSIGLGDRVQVTLKAASLLTGSLTGHLVWPQKSSILPAQGDESPAVRGKRSNGAASKRRKKQKAGQNAKLKGKKS